MGIFQSSSDDSAMKPRWGESDETELRTVSEGTMAGVGNGWDVWAGLYPGDRWDSGATSYSKESELGEEEFGFDYKAPVGRPGRPVQQVVRGLRHTAAGRASASGMNAG